MKKPRINFRQPATGGVRNNNGVEIKPLTPRYAPDMARLYTGITSEILASHGLDPSIGSPYRDEQTATGHLEALQDISTDGAYAILYRPDTTVLGVGDMLGVATLERETAKHSNVLRTLRDNNETGVRTFSSWLRVEAREIITPDEVIDECLDLARRVGVETVKIAVVQGLQAPSDEIVVVQHEINPSSHGFIRVGALVVQAGNLSYTAEVFDHTF